ncbi:MAG: methyltransferase domain-containing protein [Hyphomicrobiaceae bacterium]
MSKELVQKQFGANAAAYVTSAVHAKGDSLKRLVELVKPEKHWRALDVATAAGHTALAFAPSVAHVVASDLTDEMLVQASKLAAERGVTNFETAKADAEALPFADKSFDLVSCRIAPHHFPDIPRFVAEVWRVLKPGGTFALVDNVSPDDETTPGFPAADLAEAAATYNEFEKIRDPSHGRALTVSEWKRVVSGQGFAITHTELMDKAMDFATWCRNMQVPATTVPGLKAMLDEASPAFRAFIRPSATGEAGGFVLIELVLIARKAA